MPQSTAGSGVTEALSRTDLPGAHPALDLPTSPDLSVTPVTGGAPPTPKKTETAKFQRETAEKSRPGFTSHEVHVVSDASAAPADLLLPARDRALRPACPKQDVCRARDGAPATCGMPTPCGWAGRWRPEPQGACPTERAGCAAATGPLFSLFSDAHRRARSTGVPLAVSSTASRRSLRRRGVHRDVQPGAARRDAENRRSSPIRCGSSSSPRRARGGGGGGGALQRGAAARRSMRRPSPDQQPVARTDRPEPMVPMPARRPRRSPRRRCKAEPLPAIVAPIITAPADARNRVGVLQPTTIAGSHGPGKGGGVGTGTGTGLGQGDGSGIGPGLGGGTGGGPYRPGRQRHRGAASAARGESGLLGRRRAPARAGGRRRAGDRRAPRRHRRRREALKGLGGGLNDRAVQAVRQWRFAAQRQRALRSTSSWKSQWSSAAVDVSCCSSRCCSMLLAAIMSVVALARGARGAAPV